LPEKYQQFISPLIRWKVSSSFHYPGLISTQSSLCQQTVETVSPLSGVHNFAEVISNIYPTGCLCTGQHSASVATG